MKFDEMLQIGVIVASLVQFYLSFIKGRSSTKEYGERLLVINMNYMKRRFLALLFVGIIIYFIYVSITERFSALGVLIVFYMLLSIYDFSKVLIVTNKGIGQKSFYTNSYYNFTSWNDVIEYNWHEEKKDMIMFKVKKREKIETKDWIVTISQKDDVNKLFEKYSKKSS